MLIRFIGVLVALACMVFGALYFRVGMDAGGRVALFLEGCGVVAFVGGLFVLRGVVISVVLKRRS